MRTFYIFSNLFLFILAVLLLAVNIAFKPHPPDKILSAAPVLNETVSSAQKIKGGREEIPDIASLWDNNLFSPYRSGEGGALLGAARPTGMELMGVCSFGDVSGAIILDKQASAAAPQAGRLRNKGISPPGAASATAPRFYKLGEQLENGFTLSEINPDSVVLSRGREQIVLKLEFEDDGSASRITAAATASEAANAAIKIEQKPLQNGQPETPETPETAEVTVAPGAKVAPSAPVARAVRGTPAATGVTLTPPRVQPPRTPRAAPGQ
ncbi:MAG: hypothetical protein WCS96_05990 [Victivallales bacterium]